MIVSVFSDGERKDKIAEFYDTNFPCAFLRGVLVEAEELEENRQLMFTVRQNVYEQKPIDEGYNTEFLKNMERGDL